MTGCRNCEQSMSGDCGAHGPTYPVGVVEMRPAPVGVVAPCGPEALGVMHRAPLEAEIARLTAELAAEREKRAESEAREQRMRTEIGAVIVQSSERPDLTPLLRVFAEPASADALRAHVASAVERVVAAARQAMQSHAEHGVASLAQAAQDAGDNEGADSVLAAIEAAAKRETT